MLSSGEITLDLRESVREADVYIIKCVSRECQACAPASFELSR